MISIITPALGSPESLYSCVNSVRSQAAEHEHIIINKGGMSAVLVHAANSGAHVVIGDDNSMYEALNIGITKARGEVIGILNSDEQYLPGALELVAKQFSEDGLDVLVGSKIVVDENLSPLYCRRPIIPSQRYIHAFGTEISTCSMFIKKTVFERIGLFDQTLRAVADAKFICSMLNSGLMMRTVKDPLAYYMLTGRNLGNSQVAHMEIRREFPRYFFPQRTAIRLVHQIKRLIGGFFSESNIDSTICLASPDGARRKLCMRLSWRRLSR